MAVGWRPQCSQIEPRLDFQVELVRLALTVSWVFLLYIVSACTVSAIYNLFQISIDGKSEAATTECFQQPPGLSANYQTTLLLTRVLQEFYKSPYNPQNLRILYTFLVNGDIKGKSRIFATLALDKNRAECCCPFACLETDMLCHRLPKICTVQARIK